EKRPIEIGSIIKEALKLIRSTLPTTIEIRTDIRTPGAVEADPTQIHQIIMNLCTNAYHAMRENGGVLTVLLAKGFTLPFVCFWTMMTLIAVGLFSAFLRKDVHLSFKKIIEGRILTIKGKPMN
ncbi:MAG: hypothetical protein ACFFG0_57225, partial [Candidatus Thorarchaeota archaeon]